MRPASFMLRGVLLLLACIFQALAADPKYSSTITLSYEFISSPSKPSPLATISYDPSTLRYSLSSWTPPSIADLKSSSQDPTSAPLIRILTPGGSSTVTTLSTFASDLKQNINLFLSSTDNAVLSASVTSIRPAPLTEEEAHYRKKLERAKARGKPLPSPPKPQKPKKPKKGQPVPVVPETPIDDTPEGQPKVNLIPELEGPRPKLMSRAAPVVDEHGNEVPQAEQQEKTFLQKYWWVLVAGLVLTMGMGGGEGK
ncbi:uncharacterized protein HMPREF1541_01312 [Cyphellophora europaea CBS 101466]|uniref:ER membrane protein complex subunit 10 n=1 Tax=Cyphellophora europaea (strain CBS 101466) TaxID=1220924 RepID=W2SEK2_CYPE1|nr:uncharacterized protein HMPREF1541_01312 [Cyphellophora europaea CBS 101466]ETN47122.1 hypothetical protein HMPREF1541_01312 [Cyphellophora europaea CBS 101466]